MDGHKTYRLLVNYVPLPVEVSLGENGKAVLVWTATKLIGYW